ncbi:MAG TPA: DUF4150 domain-containing protein [Byssovorax sp.]|jgi:hypothetical protein
MFPIATIEGGITEHQSPDVCLIKPVGIPIPFPNIAALPLATGFIANVLVQMMPTVVLTSSIANSTGDEPGTLGGVVSGKYTKKSAFVQASSKVFAAGVPVVFLTAATTQNNANTDGTVKVVANTTVFTAP